MVDKKKNNKLEHWEIRLIKAMIKHKNDQDVLAYFTRPARSINHARIAEIRREKKHAAILPASEEEVSVFLENWPLVDAKTGLHLHGDELLIKAREAILLAVQTYNNPTAYFKSEVFIVTAVIAWTYLMHAYFKSKNVDYRYYKGGKVKKTRHGADTYWELGKCLKSAVCPLPQGVKDNLEYLIGIRHEIEHRMTKKIDDCLGPKLHACCLNFNFEIKRLFGGEYAVDKDLSFSLQFASFSDKQRKDIAKLDELPNNLSSFIRKFSDGLSDAQKDDRAFQVQYYLVEKNASKKGQADQVIEFVKGSSDIGVEANRVLIRDRERNKFKPSQVVAKMQEEGFKKFKVHHHTRFWQTLGAKAADKKYGISLSDGQWYWYKSWVDCVRGHCQENSESYT